MKLVNTCRLVSSPEEEPIVLRLIIKKNEKIIMEEKSERASARGKDVDKNGEIDR
jgi:hypothetical protein